MEHVTHQVDHPIGHLEPSHLERKLETFIRLGPDDRAALRRIVAKGYPAAAGTDLIEEGATPEHVFLLVSGWGFRYKMTPEGKRQILAFLLPGDICDMHIYILKQMDHAIGMLSDGVVVAVPKGDLLTMMQQQPRIQQGIWWATLQDEAVLREWLVNVGQRPALERMAHLFCELYLRMQAIGLLGHGGIALPFTQQVLADALGMTPVHVNRTLQKMRADGLIHFRAKHLEILDFPRLADIADFTSNYLHFDRS